ncbi:MAG: transglutaminase-like domain-containing protein [Paludibacteraceae bacterium]|nr:transglutaminase-like domain-containing protein [Paludibacteraceae bacterium]
MKKGTKIGLAVGFIGIGGFLIWNTISRAKNFANNLVVTPMWYGKPKDMQVSMQGVKLPLAVDFVNRSDFSVSVRLNSFDVVNSAGKVIANNTSATNTITIPANGTGRMPVDVWIPIATLATIIVSAVQSIANGDIEIIQNKCKELVDGCTMKFGLTINNIANVALSVVLDEKEEIPVEQPVSGLGLVAKTQRRIGSIQDYIDLIPSESKLLRNDDYIQSNVSPEETASFIRKMAIKYRKDTEQLAYALERNTIEETVQAIFDFVYSYIKYEEDAPDREQVRRPLRTLYEQKGDCDCYAMLIASICENLDLNYKLRIAEYNNRGYYQHIYCIVEGYTCDPVLDTCFEEKRPTKKKDF